MTDYKQLCTKLVDAIDSGIPTERMYSSPLMLRVRAALAEPKTDGPTDEAIKELQEAMDQEAIYRSELNTSFT